MWSNIRSMTGKWPTTQIQVMGNGTIELKELKTNKARSNIIMREYVTKEYYTRKAIELSFIYGR